MASNHGKSEDRKGFAGLDGLLSDISDDESTCNQRMGSPSLPLSPASTPPPAEVASEIPSPPSKHQTPNISNPTVRQPAPATTPPQDRPNSNPPQKPGGIKWGWVIVIGFFAVLYFNSNTKPTNSNALPSPDASTLAPNKSKVEQMPPVGIDRIFSNDEIRYCLSEDIRIEAMKSSVNDYSSNEISRLNLAVDDYNSRCLSYRYRKGALETIRSEVETNRSSLFTEGRGRVLSWRPSTEPVPNSQSYQPAPVPTYTSPVPTTPTPPSYQAAQQPRDTAPAPSGSNAKGKSTEHRESRNRSQLDVDANMDRSNVQKPQPNVSCPYRSRNQRDNGCVVVPENGIATTYGWRCKSGYVKNGEVCEPVSVSAPEDATYDETAPDGWKCKSRFYKQGSTCKELPPNAVASKTRPEGWACPNGTKFEGDRCSIVSIPDGGTPSPYLPQGWVCQSGRVQSGNLCAWQGRD